MKAVCLAFLLLAISLPVFSQELRPINPQKGRTRILALEGQNICSLSFSDFSPTYRLQGQSASPQKKAFNFKHPFETSFGCRLKGLLLEYAFLDGAEKLKTPILSGSSSYDYLQVHQERLGVGWSYSLWQNQLTLDLWLGKYNLTYQLAQAQALSPETILQGNLAALGFVYYLNAFLALEARFMRGLDQEGLKEQKNLGLQFLMRY